MAINYAGNQEAALACKHLCEEVSPARSGAAFELIQADISSPPDRVRLLDSVVQKYGRLDLLVNNAGVAPTVRADLLEAGEESFDRLLAVNLKGPYFLTQAVTRFWVDHLDKDSTQARPKIVIISSISAYTASVNRGDYCISKAGLSMMTKLFAARLAEYGIHVYEIRPGVIATDMTEAVKGKYDKLISEGLTPIRRWGSAEDVGRAVAAVAEDRFPFSTGEVINVDGGFHLHIL